MRNWATTKTRAQFFYSADLKEAGLRVEAGVADESTAFIATYGHGSPIIRVLGEFDALPGLSQAAVPDRNPLATAAPGHGCGHNLLGSGALTTPGCEPATEWPRSLEG
jgi:metal-dependent amidase/aminoacylase/carboxypeptidase family protein